MDGDDWQLIETRFFVTDTSDSFYGSQMNY